VRLGRQAGGDGGGGGGGRFSWIAAWVEGGVARATTILCRGQHWPGGGLPAQRSGRRDESWSIRRLSCRWRIRDSFSRVNFRFFIFFSLSIVGDFFVEV